MPTYSGYLGHGNEDTALGGLVFRAAAAAALLIGDGVFTSASNQVNKSVTAGDRLKRAGLVVGPDSPSVTRAASLVGSAAAAALNDRVNVCYAGPAYGIAGSAILAGQQLMFSAAVAGRLIPATPTTDAGKIVGTALEDQATTAAAVKVLVGLC
jgi:hypothetical protein